MITSTPLIIVTTLHLLSTIYYCQAERVSDKIYLPLQSNHYCTRRLNATHQVGCQSELGGNLGIVWVVEDANDVEHIINSGPTPPYVAILSREYFTRDNLLLFKNKTNRVAGVIFLDRNHDDSKARGSTFSPDDVCPNRYSGLYANDTRYSECKENEWQKGSNVSGLLYDDIPYPIFLINETQSTEDIDNCFKDNNVIYPKGESNKTNKVQSSYPLCGMQLDSFMLAASDANLCLNSHSFVDDLLQSSGRRCYPVHNRNIFAYYKPSIAPLQPKKNSTLMIPDVTPKQSIVMLMAKLSSLSLFSDISPGADSTKTSIITLLTVAEALGKVRNSTDVTKSNRNIAFALLDSEPFDYTGSNRMVFDMQHNAFPTNYGEEVSAKKPSLAMQNTNLTSIDYVINLDQMANYPNSDSIYVHRNPDDKNNEKLNNLYKIMDRIAYEEKVTLVAADPKIPLPPTPLHQFIQGSQELDKDSLAGIVLSNYDKKYNNLFYHSIYDDPHNIFQKSKTKLVEHIAQVSKLIARSLYEITFNAKSSNIKIDNKLVEQLVDCYLKKAECDLFTEVWKAGQKLPDGPIQTYKDPTKRSDDMNGEITAHLLAYFIGDKLHGYNVTKCYHENQISLEYNYVYVNGKPEPISNGSSGVCIRSQVSMLSSQSPAYSLNDDGEWIIDNKYPAWTVSLNGIRNPVRLYLKPSPVSQWTIFLLGLVITLMSIIAIYHVKEIAQVESRDELQTGTPA